ncbi:TlpA disulfide reductase family protein [Flavobacterium sp. H122]|uniref:TlpA family protein disulfide reductase n=1 Tax=Flavobacterium sp. H122 TaxID=2529860 RepID=UPI0010A9E612|nr:TlpA disulfide reductase family protein [Flavobacterium sp. H122]
MKKIIILALAVILNLSCSNTREKLSDKALNFELTNAAGKKVALKEIIKNHKGKAVVLEFWASWCGDCVKNMPNVKKLQTENPTTDFVFISFDKTPEAWKAGIEKHELVGEQYYVGETMKGDFGKAVGIDWIPRYMVLNQKGKVELYRAIETDNEKVEALLKGLAN